MVIDRAKPIARAYYQRTDSLAISQELLGKLLVAQAEHGKPTAGRIVETEAYLAPEDQASHAYQFKKTKRTATMFLPGGVAYVYLCYGIHAMFNIITHQEGMPHAILVRAVEPIEGIEHMLERRRMEKPKPQLTRGPGCLTKAFGIHRGHDQMPLDSDLFWLADDGYEVDTFDIESGPRVGIPNAGKFRDVPWRFYLKDNKWVSRP